jgi:hypothetical protein
LGHAFVSVTVLAGSYAFYQGRREWFYAAKQARIVPSEREESG